MGKPYKTQEKFLSQLKEIYGELYDISMVKYIADRDKVKLGCQIHGIFEQTPNHLLSGKNGCQQCSEKRRKLSKVLSNSEFINRANKLHNNRYDYSSSVYIRGDQKVKIICKIHGIFEQIPSTHLSGRGCPKCYELTRGQSQKFTKEIFIKKSIEKHGTKYDYSKVEYKNSQLKVIIICPIHGEFLQRPTSHLKYGCQLCANYENTKNLRMTTEEFIKKAKAFHLNMYDYSETEYKENNATKVKIICRKHGPFFQEPCSHISGKGCPKCIGSIGERKIRKYLTEQKINFEEQKTFPSCKFKRALRFDFYIKQLNLLIEFDGIQHFKEELENSKFDNSFYDDAIEIRDNFKTSWCEEHQINLLRIKYDEVPELKIKEYLEFLEIPVDTKIQKDSIINFSKQEPIT